MFKEMMKNYDMQSELMQTVTEKIEKQYIRQCRLHNITSESEPLELCSASSLQPCFYFRQGKTRLSMFMIILPTGDMILTENPESYSVVMDVQDINLN